MVVLRSSYRVLVRGPTLVTKGTSAETFDKVAVALAAVNHVGTSRALLPVVSACDGDDAAQRSCGCIIGAHHALVPNDSAFNACVSFAPGTLDLVFRGAAPKGFCWHKIERGAA